MSWGCTTHAASGRWVGGQAGVGRGGTSGARPGPVLQVQCSGRQGTRHLPTTAPLHDPPCLGMQTEGWPMLRREYQQLVELARRNAQE